MLLFANQRNLMAKLALLAGGGVLPHLIAEAWHKDEHGKEREVFIIAFRGFTDKEWVARYPHQWVRLGQLGKVLSVLTRQKIDTIVFAGHVRRPSLMQVRPDFEGLKMLWRLKKQRLGDDALLRQLAETFQNKGIALVGADEILPQCLMPSGVITKETPSEDVQKDIRYATQVLKAWAALDQGQAIVVQQGLILGVEAIEGTDELIHRCGTYKRPGAGPVLVKIKKPQQDRRLDMPTIGQQTIQNAIDAGFSGIAVEAGDALFLQPSQSLELANNHNLFVMGFDPS